MKKILTLAFIFSFSASTSASLIDFRTTPYASTFGPNTTTDMVDGVNFAITATARGVNGFRQNFAGAGLNFGIPGNGMYSLSIVSDTDIEYTSLVGRGHTQTSSAGQLPFDLSVNGNLQLDNLLFAANVFSTASLGNISVTAGEAFLIDVDFGSLVGSSANASAVLQSLNFNTVLAPSTVPVPATLLLFISGLGFLRLGGRNKK